MGSENLDIREALDFRGITADVPGVSLVSSFPVTVRRSRDPLKLRPVKVADSDNGAFSVVVASPRNQGVCLMLREVSAIHHSRLWSTGVAARLATLQLQATTPITLLVDAAECPEPSTKSSEGWYCFKDLTTASWAQFDAVDWIESRFRS